MASRKQDLLGRILDTTLQPDDYDPTMDSDGGTALYVPLDANLSDDTEADDAFSALREELSPGEATSVVETMRPLSAAEQEILRNNPGLKGLTRVDDAEHEDWMIDNSRRGYEGLDPILDDAVYGASHMNHNEEKMEQLGLDSDTGFGFRSIRRGISKGLRKAGKTAYKYSGAKKTRQSRQEIRAKSRCCQSQIGEKSPQETLGRARQLARTSGPKSRSSPATPKIRDGVQTLGHRANSQGRIAHEIHRRQRRDSGSRYPGQRHHGLLVEPPFMVLREVKRHRQPNPRCSLALRT